MVFGGGFRGSPQHDRMREVMRRVSERSGPQHNQNLRGIYSGKGCLTLFLVVAVVVIIVVVVRTV